MTSSSNPVLERGLDTMLIVYSLLQGHPASLVCEQFIAGRTGWFTSPLTIFGAQAVLTKVYGVDESQVKQKLEKFVAGPIIVPPLELSHALAALSLAELHKLDLSDAVLLETSTVLGTKILATEDAQLTQACSVAGFQVETPIDRMLRQQIAAWEQAHVPSKGLPRFLRQIHDWLAKTSPAVAQLFWSQSGGGSHLP